MGSKAPDDKSEAAATTAPSRHVIERALRDAQAMVWPLRAIAEAMYVSATRMRPKSHADAFRADLDRTIERMAFDDAAFVDAFSVALERQLAVEAGCRERRS